MVKREIFTAIALSKIIRGIDKHTRISRTKRYTCQDRPYPMHGRHAGPLKSFRVSIILSG